MDIEQIKADVQKVLDDLNAFPPIAPVAKAVAGITFTDAGFTVAYTDGTSVNFVPEQ